MDATSPAGRASHTHEVLCDYHKTLCVVPARSDTCGAFLRGVIRPRKCCDVPLHCSFLPAMCRHPVGAVNRLKEGLSATGGSCSCEGRLPVLHASFHHNTPPLDKPECSALPLGYHPSKFTEVLSSIPPLSSDTRSTWHHYQVSITPEHNYKGRRSTCIRLAGGRSFRFEGFSVLSAFPLHNVPTCNLHRFKFVYKLSLVPSQVPRELVVQEPLLFQEYLFLHLLELYEWLQVLVPYSDHLVFLPQFIEQESKDVLPISEVLKYLTQSLSPLAIARMSNVSWTLADVLATHPYKSPGCVRVDRLEWSHRAKVSHVRLLELYKHFQQCAECPDAVHFSAQKTPSAAESKSLQEKYETFQQLHRRTVDGNLSRAQHFQYKSLKQELRTQPSPYKDLGLRSEEALMFTTDGLLDTGLYADVAQHALALPVLFSHVVLHVLALPQLEARLAYHFTNRLLLQQSLVHPSHSPHMVDEQERTAQSNCGVRGPQLARPLAREGGSGGVRKGLVALVDLDPQTSSSASSSSPFNDNNERLEFLGDAILEFLCSLHLYHLLPHHSDGELTIFRRALVNNRHLCCVAERLGLPSCLVLASCLQPASSPEDFDHAAANGLEALVGAVMLDGGLASCQGLVARLLFQEQELCSVWLDYPPDPLQLEDVSGDRHMIKDSKVLQLMVKLEERVGVKFRHIRLLARAFMHSSVGYTNLTMGNYQRLEFLGDAVLQFLTSQHVYLSFPRHHEGHLTFLRMSLVHNKQLASICRKLGLIDFLHSSKTECITIGDKIQADLVESFLAALLLDQGLTFAQRFCEVCIFPKLKESSQGLRWLDSKSRLQYSIVHTCKVERHTVEMPVYSVVKTEGPSHCKTFTVAVMFRERSIGVGRGKSVHEAGMEAAENALQSGHVVLPDALKV